MINVAAMKVSQSPSKVTAKHQASQQQTQAAPKLVLSFTRKIRKILEGLFVTESGSGEREPAHLATSSKERAAPDKLRSATANTPQ